jgi:hypothetical protein
MASVDPLIGCRTSTVIARGRHAKKKRFYAGRTMTSIVTYLKQADIFYQLTQTQLELIANICKEVVFSAGQIVFEENSTSKELYVIAHGEVDILVNPAMVAGRTFTKIPEKVIIDIKAGAMLWGGRPRR